MLSIKFATGKFVMIGALFQPEKVITKKKKQINKSLYTNYTIFTSLKYSNTLWNQQNYTLLKMSLHFSTHTSLIDGKNKVKGRGTH